MTTIEVLLILNKIPGVHAHTVRLLTEACHDVKDLLRPDLLATLETRSAFGKRLAHGVRKTISQFDPRRECELAQKKNIDIIPYTDGRYPRALRETYDPPVVLYVKGAPSVLGRESIAMVGSRSASFYGKEMAHSIARCFAQHDIPVVSGLARGIDAAAHQGVLSIAGATIAVLGCGVDIIYPRANKKIYDEIIARDGAIVSEYSLGAIPYPANFPQRNRIISGMTRGTIVVEAAQRSGSLITARLALEEGRDVFCLPGQATSVRSHGTNNLIKQGAVLITDARDVIDALFPEAQYREAPQQAAKPMRQNSQLHEKEARIFALIGRAPVSVDELLLKTGTCVDRIYSSLLTLELKRKIKRCYNGGYIRVA
jgi:DNA processing protein